MRPVAAQHARRPRPHDVRTALVERAHPERPRVGIGVQEAEREARVLRRVQVVPVRGGGAGQVVEAVAGAEVGNLAATAGALGLVDEAAHLVHQVAHQLARASDRHRRRVHAAVPADLVEPDRRVAPEAPERSAHDAVRDPRRQLRREPERRARLPGHGQPVGHLLVDHQVLDGAVEPAGRVPLVGGAGAGLAEPRLAAQLLGDPQRPVVAPRRPGVPGHRGDGMDQQHVGLDHRLGGRVGPARFAPQRVHAGLHAVDEGPIGGGIPAGGRRRGQRRAGPPQPAREQPAEREPRRGQELAAVQPRRGRSCRRVLIRQADEGTNPR